MSIPSTDVWARANRIARLAMGKHERATRYGYPRLSSWKADDDPLACWCLTELIVGVATIKRTQPTTGPRE